jgi:lipoate-protein ligase A
VCSSDLINFTFITDKEDENFDFAFFCHPVTEILQSLGADAKISGRNDMTIYGMKFSGNSQYIKHGRIMHHGTIMFDSDLNVLSHALAVSKDMIESKGRKSRRSRVTNVRPHIAVDCSTEDFMNILELELIKRLDAETILIETINMNEVNRLHSDIYDTWEWNYGASPPCNIRRKRVFEGAGEIEIRMEVTGGRIRSLAFYGDFFSKKDPDRLAKAFIGIEVNETSIMKVLRHLRADDYFKNLRNEDLASLFSP